MNYFQIHHVLTECNARISSMQNTLSVPYSTEWENIQKQFGDDFSHEAKFSDYEEIMKDVSKWYQTQLPGFGIGIAGGSGPAAKELKEEKKEEKIEEKKEVLIVYKF